jgi:hypothetical protein
VIEENANFKRCPEPHISTREHQKITLFNATVNLFNKKVIRSRSAFIKKTARNLLQSTCAVEGFKTVHI